MNEKVKPVNRLYPSIGAIPTSYLISLSYEEQLIYLCRKIDEVINVINGSIDEILEHYIEQKFNDIVLNTLYESETETLVLYLDSEVI